MFEFLKILLRTGNFFSLALNTAVDLSYVFLYIIYKENIICCNFSSWASKKFGICQACLFNVFACIFVNKFQRNSAQYTFIFFQENGFENVICKISDILFMLQCVNQLIKNEYNFRYGLRNINHRKHLTFLAVTNNTIWWFQHCMNITSFNIPG